MGNSKRLIFLIAAAAVLLAIPAIAMIFTAEVNWTALDFVVGGVLLFGTGILCELALRLLQKTSHRMIACAVILLALFIIWAELAVGIVGTPFAGS
ncbi:MAG: hypothetical protein IPM50_10675 [Acidobacteriota bacterium]|nr:MAG: hypothetical protein IPM50_10675 [Acidobacteriota bacterium]